MKKVIIICGVFVLGATATGTVLGLIALGQCIELLIKKQGVTQKMHEGPKK